jgi:hypothetical protein
MGRRLSTNTRAWVYRFLMLRDGEACRTCGLNPSGALVHHEVDHIDHDPTNWAPDNLQLLCKPCNVAKENRRRRNGRARLHEIKLPPGRAPSNNNHEGGRGRDLGSILKEAVGYEDAGAELRLNARYEPMYRAWVVNQVLEHGFLGKAEAINGGAEYSGCNPKTAKHYLDKLTSTVGPLLEARDMLNMPIIVPKPEPQPEQQPKKGDTMQNAPTRPAKPRWALEQGQEVAQRLLPVLAPACERIEIAGSVRRSAPTIGDVELLVIPRQFQDEGAALIPYQHKLYYDELDQLTQALVADKVLAYRPNARKRTAYGRLNRFLQDVRTGIPVDIFVTTAQHWGMSMMVRTGPAEWNIRFMGRLITLGLRGHAYGGITGRLGQELPVTTEEQVFEALQWAYSPPEQRR